MHPHDATGAQPAVQPLLAPTVARRLPGSEQSSLCRRGGPQGELGRDSCALGHDASIVDGRVDGEVGCTVRVGCDHTFASWVALGVTTFANAPEGSHLSAAFAIRVTP